MGLKLNKDEVQKYTTVPSKPSLTGQATLDKGNHRGLQPRR